MAHRPSRSYVVNLTAEQASRFWSLVQKGEGCWRWIGAGSGRDGYGSIRFDGVVHFAHRLSFALANGGTIADGRILHRCDTPRCVRPDHLFAGTALDNSRDAKAKNRPIGGVKNRALTDAQAEEVRSLYSRYSRGTEHTQEALARRFGVGRMAIRSALTRTFVVAESRGVARVRRVLEEETKRKVG